MDGDSALPSTVSVFTPLCLSSPGVYSAFYYSFWYDKIVTSCKQFLFQFYEFADISRASYFIKRYV